MRVVELTMCLWSSCTPNTVCSTAHIKYSSFKNKHTSVDHGCCEKHTSYMFDTECNIRRSVQTNPNPKVISNPSQIAINVCSMIILPSDDLFHHSSSRVWGRRLRRQLIDRLPRKHQQDRSNWWEMFTSLTSAQITSEKGIFFKALIDHTSKCIP